MLQKTVKEIDRELRNFARDSEFIKNSSKAAPFLADSLRDLITRKGKRIRPLLFICSYLGYTDSNEMDMKVLLRSSLSMEILHVFLLIHDDIIDRSSFRRGKPTIHRIFNKKLGLEENDRTGPDLAIVAGDILYTSAINCLLSMNELPERKEKALKLFLSAASNTGTGEFLDILNDKKNIEEILPEDILATYEMKTADYTFSSPLLIGASLAGTDENESKRLSSYGRKTGIAFQLLDDLLDVFGDPAVTGKPAFNDIRSGKRTLLASGTLRALTGNSQKDFITLFAKKDKTEQDCVRIKDLIRSSGAGKDTRDLAFEMLEEAEIDLIKLKMRPEQKDTVASLNEKIRKGLENIISPPHTER
jgi:geranylgeranyl diphosphate synthase type I